MPEWALEVLPNAHLWGVLFGWVGLYLIGRLLVRAF
jgi:hypothetical protein